MNKDVFKAAAATMGANGDLTPELREATELLTAFGTGVRDKDMYLRLSLLLGWQQANYISPFSKAIDKLKLEMTALSEIQKQIKNEEIKSKTGLLNEAILKYIKSNESLYFAQTTPINNMMMYFLDLTKGKPIVENDVWRLNGDLKKYMDDTVTNVNEIIIDMKNIEPTSQNLKNTLSSKKYPSEF